jgi:hypothetical protein
LQYLKILTKKANEKIEDNKLRTERFFCNLRIILGSREQDTITNEKS